MKNRIAVLMFLTLLPVLELSSNAWAADANTIYMDETYISGNQELPKVLYILPWKNQQGEAVPAVNPILADRGIMAPIYPHEYRLEMAYRALTHGVTNTSGEQMLHKSGKPISRNQSEED